jgi:tRNA(fMet)-specific endonuclease VapC
MASYLLDANHASPLVTIRHPLRKRFLAAVQDGHDFAVCVPVVSEVLFGITLLPRAEQNRAEWARLRASLTCYQLDEVDAERAADLQVRRLVGVGRG